MTDHPCKGMTKAQIAAFERMVVDEGYSGVRSPTLNALERRKLIMFSPSRGWYVPIYRHAEWCKWCSEQPENQEDWA